MELTKEEERTLHAYLLVFSSDLGKVVLDDLRKWTRKPFDETRFNDKGYLVQRAAEYNMVKRIERCMERAAEEVQKMDGVMPAVTPEVETEEGDI